MGQMIFTGLGAAVGGYFGGPMGAEAGGLIGGIIGTIFFPDHKAPNMPDMRIQNSAYGQPIPWAYGVMRVSGNVIWAGVPHVHSQKVRQGKGFMSPSYTTNNYQISFAVGLCEGPITGVRRIWANGKLIYDISNPSDFEQLSGSQNMTTNFNVYPGSETQNPDPIMESQLGVGNVPAHRGMAYVVFNELDLTSYGNIIPNLSFEVMVETTPPYINTGKFVYTPPAIIVNNSGSLVLSSMTSGGGQGWYYGLWAPDTRFFGYVPVSATPYGIVSNGPAAEAPFGLGGFVLYTIDLNGLGQAVTVAGVVLDPTANGISSNGQSLGAYGLWQISNPSALNLDIYNDLIIMKGSWIVNIGGTFNKGVYSYNGSQYQSWIPEPGLTGVNTWQYLGMTDDYFYCTPSNSASIYFNKIVRLDQNLNPTVMPGTMTFSPVSAFGYAENDSSIYIFGVGLTLWHWDGSTFTNTGIPSDQSGNSRNFVWQSGIQYYSSSAYSYNFYAIAPDYTNLPPVTVKQIVDDVCARAGLVSGQWDATNCLDSVDGYLVQNNSSGRDALQPLLQMYFTDVCDTDGLLKFVRRGASPTITIPYSALGAVEQGNGVASNPLRRSLQQEVDLPKSLTVTYYGSNNDYNFVNQTAYRTQTSSNYKASVRAAVAMADDAALSVAQTLLWSTWANQETYAFETDLGYLYLEPTDVIGVTDKHGKVRTVRLNKAQYDGKAIMKWTAQAEVPLLYPAYGVKLPVQGAAPLGYVPQRVGYAGPTVLAILDIPPLANADVSQGLYVAACGYSSSWPGCVVDMSRDNSTFSEMTTLTNPAAIGLTNNVIGGFSGGNQPDELNTISVTLSDPASTLGSISYANFLNNENVALIGSELIGFRNATLVSGTTYTLNGLLRGLQGTEWAISTHTSSERFVCLTGGGISAVGINVNDLGQPLYFQPITLTQAAPITPESSITPVCARVQPLSVSQLVAFEQGTGAAASVLMRWFRRARVFNQWTDGTDVPLDESSEAYTITAGDVNGNLLFNYSFTQSFTGGTQPTATWPATALGAGMSGLPFGSVTAGTQVTIRVQQHSDQGVLGRASTFTFTKV